jgi:tricorn protease-like protein
MKWLVYCILFCSTLLSACFSLDYNPEPREAYVPVYGAGSDSIRVGSPAPTIKGGKIFVLNNKLFQVETGTGIHIIDYTDKKQPKKLGFLHIPGCMEVAVKGNQLYTNQRQDLVVLDVSAYPAIKIDSRQQGIFPDMTVEPPVANVWYVCPEPGKGQVIRWEVKKVKQHLCHN